MAAKLSPEKRALLTKDFLIQEYCILKKGVRKIAEEIGIGSDRTIYNYLLKYNIRPRSQKKSCQTRNQANKKNPNYKHGKSKQKAYCVDCGKELSDYRKKRCQSCNNKGSRSPFYGKPPAHGKHFKYRGYNLRSSYELAVAKYLDLFGFIWNYECTTFELSNGKTYTPDFYLSEKNEYLEVKGYWRDDALEKFELFKLEYPKIKLTLLDKKTLKKMEII